MTPDIGVRGVLFPPHIDAILNFAGQGVILAGERSSRRSLGETC